MNRFKICTVILCVSFCAKFVATKSSSSCGDWQPYNDERCFKILDVPLQSFTDAIKSCEALDGRLPVIETKEEQNFISNYLFNISKKVDNFWLGAKFSGTSIKWQDGTSLNSYTNWDKEGARNKVDYCVQMQADEAHLGKWIDEPCAKKNAVICQKFQPWSIETLQKMLLETKRGFKDSLDKAQREISELRDETNAKIANLTQNPVPIGFIYVQLSSQPEPRTLWPTLQWTDVTTEYAGLFFRADGGGSAQFGTVQPENAPRVTEVVHERHTDSDSVDNWAKTVLNVSGQSTGIGVYSGSYYGIVHYTLQFKQSGGEVRPRNTAIRVWKRTQ